MQQDHAQPHVPTPLQAKIPNALTIFRLVLTVAFIAVLSTTMWSPFARDLSLGERLEFALSLQSGINAGVMLAALLFIVAAITDALDGYFARRWNAVSVFGRVMDPFADKILVLGAFVMLSAKSFPPGTDLIENIWGFEPWMVVVILARELLITSLRGVLESRGVDFSATLSGKLKMIIQSIAVPLILLTTALYTPFEGTNAALIVQATAWATVGITVLSAVPYLTRAAKAFATND